MSSVPRPHSEFAFTYSEIAAVVVILIFFVTIFLVLYPAVAYERGYGPLPFSAPVVYLVIGAVLLLLFVYQLGKYACIQCQGVSRGFGIWLALVSAVIYLVGAIISWGSRPARVSNLESASGL
jgi:predicted membrane channel-forming protein YqfA (hemolysin III family)